MKKLIYFFAISTIVLIATISIFTVNNSTSQASSLGGCHCHMNEVCEHYSEWFINKENDSVHDPDAVHQGCDDPGSDPVVN